MGFLYCPTCDKAISEHAKNLAACPNGCHPFDAKVWRETYEQKMAQKRLKEEEKKEQARIKEKQKGMWEAKGLCPECGGKLSWVRESEYNECMMMSFRYERQYCKTPSCMHSKYGYGIPVNSREI